jgi:hypothetical protein
MVVAGISHQVSLPSKLWGNRQPRGGSDVSFTVAFDAYSEAVTNSVARTDCFDKVKGCGRDRHPHQLGIRGGRIPDGSARNRGCHGPGGQPCLDPDSTGNGCNA